MIRVRASRGFTLVELLIVIVVIAILAAITIVAYGGVTGKAHATTAQSDVSSAASFLNTYQVSNSTFPATQSAAVTAGLKASAGTTLNYYTAAGQSFCVDATNNGSASYFSTSFGGGAIAGDCEVSKDIAGWWKLNGNANDSSGNNLTGTATGLTATADMNNIASGAYSFPGVASDDIVAPMPSFLSGASTSTPFTASAWFKTSSTADQKILSADNAASLHIFQVINGQFRTCLVTGCFLTGTNAANGQWHFVAVTTDGTNVTMYIDGTTIPVTGTIVNSTYTTSLYIGADHSGQYPFIGTIDDARIYDRVLASAEIQALYAAGPQ